MLGTVKISKPPPPRLLPGEALEIEATCHAAIPHTCGQDTSYTGELEVLRWNEPWRLTDFDLKGHRFVMGTRTVVDGVETVTFTWQLEFTDRALKQGYVFKILVYSRDMMVAGEKVILLGSQKTEPIAVGDVNLFKNYTVVGEKGEERLGRLR